jgi:phosphoribosylaminoimidazolecarboxamide formyltransferase/IMP cyclohydrolase
MQNHSKYALMSVFDKRDSEVLAKTLQELGYRIIATGGTKTYLEAKGISCLEVSTFTDKAEVFDGRLKTISYEMEGGILFDRGKYNHTYDVEKYSIPQIYILVCNLYPIKEKPSIEMIDIGGPNMIRAAAKNYRYVTVITDPKDYNEAAEMLLHHDYNSDEAKKFRKKCAKKAFGLVTLYDHYIFSEFSKLDLDIPAEDSIPLRYGENPHQEASVFLNESIKILPYLQKN